MSRQMEVRAPDVDGALSPRGPDWMGGEWEEVGSKEVQKV